MTIDAALTASLCAVGTVMSDARDPWWIITGAAAALHGVETGHVADVDVLLSIPDARRILLVIGIAARPGAEHPDFRSSIFGTWTSPPRPVEFMAGFHRRSGDDWVPIQPTTRQPIRVDGVTVYIPGRAELRCLIEDLGRPKDKERARRLAALG